jgi:predicted RNase H-like HicB family nuclease
VEEVDLPGAVVRLGASGYEIAREEGVSGAHSRNLAGGPDLVSLCPELGVSSCGASLEEATAMLQEAVDLYLDNARELEILDATLDALISTRRWTTSIRVAV